MSITQPESFICQPNQQCQSAEHKNRNIKREVVVFFCGLQHEDMLFL